MRALWVGLVFCALVPSLAAAQTERELAAARATFQEGVRLTQRERWDDAVARFREVLEVRATTPVKFNLALALAHTESGRLEAAQLLDEVLADPELDEAMHNSANTLRGELEGRLGRLTVSIEGDEAGASVTLDGEELSADRIGRRLWVTPGSHSLALRRGGTEIASEDVTIEAGASEEITLAPRAHEDVALDVREEGASGPAGGDVTSEWWFWTLIVGAAVLVAGGIIIGVAVSENGSVEPVLGNLDPGLLMVE